MSCSVLGSCVILHHASQGVLCNITLSSLAELQHTFAQELRDTRAEEKAKVTLECETRQPAKKVKWLKGMVELRAGRKYTMRQKGVVLSLTITSLEKSDTDVYICDVGTMQSRALLTVQGEPTLHEELSILTYKFRFFKMYFINIGFGEPVSITIFLY